MKKFLSIGLLSLAAGMLFVAAPAKANDNNDRDWNNCWNREYRYSNHSYNNFYRYHIPYNNRFDRHFDRFNYGVTYPRTVYLVDAGNSANQLNIINSTRGGSSTAAYITVNSNVYNRIVDDYNQLGVVSVHVDRFNDRVTFYTVNGTVTTNAVDIDFVR